MTTVLGPLVGGAVVLALVVLVTDDRSVRLVFLAGVIGSLLLSYESLFLASACGLGESRSVLYIARCSGVVPYLPFVGVPVLLVLAIARILWPGNARMLRGVGLFGFFVAFVVPWVLLASA